METNELSPDAEPESRLDLKVRADAGSLAEVRRALEALALPPEILEDAKVLVSEVLGNSVKHSGSQMGGYVHVTAEWSGERLRVAVHDRSGASVPMPVAGTIRPRPDAESGWGLFLVDRLASRWGTDQSGYWF